MKKMLSLMAILAVAACDSATASDRGATKNAAQPQAQETTASFSGGAGHRAVIVSVRRKVAGTPGLYSARAVAVDGGEVTVEIRASTTAFLQLTSGTFQASDTGTGEADQDFQTAAGTRYLIIAYPSSGGGSTLDAAHAAFTEAVP